MIVGGRGAATASTGRKRLATGVVVGVVIAAVAASSALAALLTFWLLRRRNSQYSKRKLYRGTVINYYSIMLRYISHDLP